jgi:stearoyl-CoA desaturase (delta-9 desaturase)
VLIKRVGSAVVLLPRAKSWDTLEESLAKSSALQTAYRMRAELAALWNRSSATREQLVAQLQDWCHRAETSGIGPLRDFSMRLRSYA